MGYLGIALLPFLLYFPAINGQWIFDDYYLLYEPTTAFIRDGSLKEWYRIQFRNLSGFRQLSWLTFVLTRKLCRGDWKSVENKEFRILCHLINILLHTINALLVASVGGPLAGFVYAIHPGLSSAVSYISSRPSLLATAFGLSGVSLILHGHPILAWLCLPFAILSKEDSVIFALLYAVLAPHLWWLYLAPVVAGALWKWRTIRNVLTSKESGALGWEQNGVPCLHGWDFYKASFTEHALRVPAWIFGFRLNPDPYITKVRHLTFLCGIVVAVISITIGTFVSVRATELSLLSPAFLYVFIETPDPVLEYRAPFAFAGFAILLSILARHLPSWLVVIGIIGFMGSTLLRAYTWSTWLDYWSWIIRKSPGKARAYINLGQAYRHVKSNWNAEFVYKEGLDAVPNCAILYQHLAAIRLEEGKPAEAEALLEDAVKRCPDSFIAWYSLGQVRINLEKHYFAALAFEQTVRIKPDHDLAWFQLGRLCLGRPEALAYLKEAIRLRPEHEVYHQHYAVACFLAKTEPELPVHWRVEVVPSP